VEFYALVSLFACGLSSSTGANLDIFLNVTPYFMNKNGTGMAITATPPNKDIAGPTPRLLNMGVAARGNEAAKALLRSVLADVALAAYKRYVSTRKLMHCWKMMLKPAPIKTAANTGTTPGTHVSISG
jgi:hypothetical protein